MKAELAVKRTFQAELGTRLYCIHCVDAASTQWMYFKTAESEATETNRENRHTALRHYQACCGSTPKRSIME